MECIICSQCTVHANELILGHTSISPQRTYLITRFPLLQVSSSLIPYLEN